MKLGHQNRRVAPLLVVLSLTACAATPVKQTAPEVTASAAQQLSQAMDLAAEKDWPSAQEAFRRLMDAKNFESLTAHEQFQALWLGAIAAIYHGDKQAGYRYLLRAAALPEAGLDQWSALLRTAATLDDRATVVRSLTTLMQRWPAQALNIDADFIEQVINESHQIPHAQSLALLQSLYDAHWKLRWGVEPSAAWRDLTLLLIENDQMGEARDVSSHITEPYMLIAMRSDRRLDTLVAASPGEFDIDAAASRELRDLERASDQSPRSLELKVRMLAALEHRERYGAMLAAADSILTELRSTNFPEKSYEDYELQYPTFIAYRATALGMSGRWDEAVVQLQEASLLREHGETNISEALDLASLYCQLGRPADAVSAVAKLGPHVSRYGLMQKELVLLWAATQLGDRKQAVSSLQYLGRHREDAPGTYFDALIIARDLNQAAKLLISRLMDRDLRESALLDVQDYAPSPSTPLVMALEAARRSVIARPDVQTAIRKVGRTQSYALESP